MIGPRRLVVLAPNWLGDAVMALPLLADLRRAWPETVLVVAARPSVAPLFGMVPGVADTITFDGTSGWRTLRAVKQNAARLADGRFDAALLLPNSFQSAWLAARARIPERWGYPRDLRGRLLTRALARPSRHVHQAAYYQALAQGLGLPTGERFARLTVADADTRRARTLVREAGAADEDRFVVFAPGAAYGRAKQWLPERFAELASLLAAQDLTTVLVGTRADGPVCREIATRVRGTTSGPARVIDLACKTDLTGLAGLLTLSDAVVSNDSGAMHLAAAVGARVIAVFGPTDDRKTAPLRADADAPAPSVLSTDVWCRPCMLRECPIDHRCMSGISARAAYEAVSLAGHGTARVSGPA